MLSRLGKNIQRFRRLFSRSEWAVQRLPPKRKKSRGQGVQAPGVLMIQIDGLGYEQFLRAIDKRKLPFLQRMVQRDHFVLRRFYSGLPSTTPAVQAEVFFGVKCAVPAFHYYDREVGLEKVMFDADVVDALAHEMEQKHEGLLSGGSSYSNIYSGGAEEASFCIQSMKLESIFRSIKLRNMALFIVANAEKIVRIIGLTLLEFGLAIYDFFAGILARRNPLREFTFIFSRIGACIVVRELVRLHVKIDIARGLPVIHANFVGYDEHAHRRNPDSAFAMWTLKGIDATIKDLVHKAVRSEKRDYHIFVYSDHGQEASVPFAVQHGREVREAIAEAFDREPLRGLSISEPVNLTPYLLLHERNTRLLRRARKKKPFQWVTHDAQIHLTAMGPLGHIYVPVRLDVRQMELFSERLVGAGIPLVLYVHNDRVICVSASGSAALADKADEVFGADHPFLQQVTEDMEILCRHREAGDFIISGWRAADRPLTFVDENGSHGGPGYSECSGFVILPDIHAIEQPALRGLDLRRLVRKVLRKDAVVLPAVSRQSPQAPQIIRVMSYNIHSCIGMDGKLFPTRIARVIGRQSPDIVALQEVDRNLSRTAQMDQLLLLGEQLDMYSAFFPVLRMGEGEYGLAILSRFPLKASRFVYLPRLPRSGATERRGIMWVQLDTPNGRLHVFNTHLSLMSRERIAQMQYILDEKILDDIPCREPVLFCGDFNAGNRSPVYTLLSRRLKDAQRLHAALQPDPTFFSSYPLFTLDHIFYSDHLAPVKVSVVNDWECRLASDHLPISGVFLHDPFHATISRDKKNHAGKTPFRSDNHDNNQNLAAGAGPVGSRTGYF